MEKGLIGVLRGSNKNTQGFVFSIMEHRLYRIGKDENCDIRINIEELICDTHCVIASSAPELPNNNLPNVYLTDISTTGTFLNGSLIGQNNTVLLYSGCVITLASKHINVQYIQYSPEDEHFPAFTMTIQPGYLSSPIQQVDTSREMTVKTTNAEIGFGNQSYIMMAYDTKSPNRQLACKYTNLRKSRLEPWLMRAYETELKILKSNNHVSRKGKAICTIQNYLKNHFGDDESKLLRLFKPKDVAGSEYYRANCSPNVLSLVAFDEHQQQKFVFVPLYYGGSLQERLNNIDPSLNRMGERNATFLMKQLFAGLDYLHDKDIIHCDIKPTNILLADRYTDRPRLVIADFGHSMLKSNKPETWPEDWGTPAYRSPEMVKLQDFSEKVDCWAAGIIFYQLLLGTHPFHGLNDKVLEKAIVMQPIDLTPLAIDNISPSSREIIAQLTHKDQYQRASIKHAARGLLCSWFNGDEKAVNDHYLKEREWWFNAMAPAVKQNTNRSIDCDDQPEAVDAIKTFRDPSNPNTFLSAAQTNLSLYPSLERRIDSFRFTREFL